MLPPPLTNPSAAQNASRGVFHVTLPHYHLKYELREFSCHHHPSPIPPLLEIQAEGVFHATTPYQPLCCSKCEWRVSYHTANNNDNDNENKDDSCTCQQQREGGVRATVVRWKVERNTSGT